MYKPSEAALAAMSDSARRKSEEFAKRTADAAEWIYKSREERRLEKQLMRAELADRGYVECYVEVTGRRRGGGGGRRPFSRSPV